MEGRWTIRNDALTTWVHGPTAYKVPVVPCDDAAVERGAMAFAAFRTPTIGWHPETDTYAVYVYTDASTTRVLESGFICTTDAARAIPRLGAEAVLRAAGESGPDPSKGGPSSHAERGAVGPPNPKPEGGES
jgi:hypothetical protein